MMHDPIQAHICHDILCVGRGSGHTPRACGRIAHDRQTHRPSSGRRRGGRPCGCEGHEAATARLIICKIIGRNEVVLRHCRRSDIETRHLSQRGERRRLARRARAGLLIALIDAISCQIRFTVGIPRQRDPPCSTRPQHKNTSESAHPVHWNTPIVFSSAADIPFPEKPISHMKNLCWTAQLTRLRGEFEAGNHSPRRCGS